MSLPEDPDGKNLDYDAVRHACMVGNIPAELDEVLFLVSILGNKRGQAQIEKEARFRKRRLDFSLDGVSCPDFAMKVWLHNWPENKDLLEASYARGRIFGKSSYLYNPMIRDFRDAYQAPTPERLAEATKELEDYFANQEELGRGTNILLYEYPKELWFLVRYPGQVERHEAVDDEGNPSSQVFRPEEYDAIVYHKVYGDLRLNTNRARDHVRYRVVFGRLLFGHGNVFDPKTRMITLEPLLGESVGIFQCEDIEGLTGIEPVEVCFSASKNIGMQIIWKAEPDVSLLHYNSQDNRLLPPDAHSPQYAKFRYRLAHRKNWEKVTVHRGQSMTYERDGDCAVIEEWLRRRRFVRSPIESQ
ncbi:MAG: hypothetical protein H7A46_21435 [Verrucomicrobiales bacterium]|nr:hypothetical protein [Verrucomicrobiales bacterium]